MDYFVYEFVQVERDVPRLHAVIHYADCPACNHGQGNPKNAGRKTGLMKWHGPFATLDAALREAGEISGRPRRCARCRPH